MIHYEGGWGRSWRWRNPDNMHMNGLTVGDCPRAAFKLNAGPQSVCAYRAPSCLPLLFRPWLTFSRASGTIDLHLVCFEYIV